MAIRLLLLMAVIAITALGTSFTSSAQAADTDSDGVADAADNCPTVANANQANTDGDNLGDACDLIVRMIPWLGLPSNPHQVFSGGQLIVAGVASVGYNDSPVTITSQVWDFGDGSPILTITGGNSLTLAQTHNYFGVDGQPFTATLTVIAAGQTATDTFKVVVRTRTIDVEANMAIDKGLWFQHTQIQRSLAGTTPIGIVAGQNGSNYVPTAGFAQAFAINNHLTTGDVAEDPYVHDVSRLLRRLEQILQVQAIGVQPGGDPDVNGNGIGLFANDNSVNYVNGQVMDALVASGTPDQLAVLGPSPQVAGRSYRDIVQDMIDFNSWGQLNNGGWYYFPNTGNRDNSIGQWPAIGGIAAERVWGLTTPPWVKALNKSAVAGTQNVSGAFGYTSFNDIIWSEGFSTTPSALVQYIYDGVRNDPSSTDLHARSFQLGLRFVANMHRVRNHYPGPDPTFGGINFYGLYATSKAYRLALNPAGVPTPITLVDDNPTDSVPAWDWYRNDPASFAPALGPRGVARAVISNQVASGEFPGFGVWTGNMTTAWGIIMLSPTLFEVGPTAVCTANPAQIGQNGGVVNFNGTGSFHNDEEGEIAGYAWSFGDGTTASGSTASHGYPSRTTFPHTYNATLTVTDSNGLTDSISCPVTQVNTNVAPDAHSGGPYTMCVGGTLTLDASGSTDEDSAVLTYKWDWTAPLNFTPADATGVTANATAAFTARAPGTYDLGLQVTDNNVVPASNAEFTTVTVKPAGDSSCSQPPVANPDLFTTAEDTPLSANVRGNDTGDGLVASILVLSPSNGSLVFNADGSFTYTPAFNYSGPDSFTYKNNNGQADSNVTTVGLTVTPLNDAPFAQPDEKTTPEDTSVSGQVTSVDVDGGPPTFTVMAAPAFGTVILNPDGTYTYTPGANYVGGDTFTYYAFDGVAASNAATVSITVTPVNDAPVGVNDQLTLDEDTSGGGNVLDNDTDVDTDHSLLTSFIPAVVNEPTHGTVTLAADGTFTYTPDTDYHGSDSFAYRVTDNALESELTTVAIIVQPTNDPPVAGDNFADTVEDTPVSGNVLPNDSDIDNDPLATTLVSNVSHGTLVFNPDGSFIYTPASNYFGPDSFTYRASDGTLDSNVATVNIVVASINDSPVCTAVAPNITSIWPPNHQLVTITLSGATDLEGDTLTYLVTGIFQDEQTNTQGDGNTAIDGFGVGTAQATVRAERIGTLQAPGDGRVYHVRYRASDPYGGSCSGEVRVGVPHDQSAERINPVDGGALFDSTVANPPVTGRRR